MSKSRKSIREEVNMRSAQLQAMLSTCSSTQVGSVIVVGNAIVSTGYNGVASGIKHCNESVIEDHKEFAERFEIHAEMNALLNALDRNTSVRGGTCYTTHSPCWNCAKHLHRAGIKDVVYLQQYHRTTDEELTLMRKTFTMRIDKFKNDEA